jgi:hypothetical protein
LFILVHECETTISVLREGRIDLGLSKQNSDKIKPSEKGQVTKGRKQLLNSINKFVSRPIAVWKKTMSARDKTLDQHLPGGTEEHQEESQHNQSPNREFNPNIGKKMKGLTLHQRSATTC